MLQGGKGEWASQERACLFQKPSKKNRKAVSVLPIRPPAIDCDWSRMRQSQKISGRGTGKCLKEFNGASTQSKPHLTPFLNIGKEIKKNKKDSYLIEDVV